MTPDLAFNTAVSFMTNTNWQSYSPDTTLSYFVQMAALAVQNFVSAAAGIAVAIALIRGFARHTTKTIGNFWVDVTRCTLYILLPLSIVAALFFVWQGSIQNFNAYYGARRSKARRRPSRRAGGVAGSDQDAGHERRRILQRELGASVTRIRRRFSNLLQMLLIFVLGAGLTYTFGKMVRDTRQGWAIFAAMAVMFLVGVFICYSAEQRGNPDHRQTGRRDAPTPALSRAATWKARRCGSAIAMSALFATVTTDASCGAVNGMHDSFTPLGGLVPLFNIQTGRSDLRRRGRRALRHADLRHPGGLHRRPDGGPHAGVRRQEDRAEGSQDGDASRCSPLPFCILVFTALSSVVAFRARRLLESARAGHREPEQRRPARLLRDPVRLHQRRGKQRQRVRRHHAPTRPGTT